MIGRVKRKIAGKISNIFRSAVRSEIENALPIIPQLIEFQNSAKEDRQSFYDHTKDPFGSIGFYEGLKDRLLSAGVPVKPVDIDIPDFERWLNDFPEIKRFYEKMGDVFIEKCLEHYLTFKHLNISLGDVYIDVASSGSPWAGILNKRGERELRSEVRGQRTEDRSRKSEVGGQKLGDSSRKGVRVYRLDLSFQKGNNGIDIGADVGDDEIGLVRKMQDRGWKIVWAPDALVWHCQTVAKNATEKDISRRYYNSGIASACSNFRKNNPNRLSLMIQIIKDRSLILQTTSFLKTYFKSYIRYKLNRNKEKPDWRLFKFKRALLKGRVNYNWRLIFDNKLREFVKREDWINE